MDWVGVTDEVCNLGEDMEKGVLELSPCIIQHHILAYHPPPPHKIILLIINNNLVYLLLERHIAGLFNAHIKCAKQNEQLCIHCPNVTD